MQKSLPESSKSHKAMILNDGEAVGAKVGNKVGDPVTIGSTPIGEEVGGTKHLLLPASKVVPSGQMHPSMFALCTKVFSQTQTAAPSTTVHSPALLQLLFLHGSIGAGAGSSQMPSSWHL